MGEAELEAGLILKIILALCAVFLVTAIIIRLYHEYHDIDPTWGNLRSGVYPGWDTSEN
jgi:hypothetical protein